MIKRNHLRESRGLSLTGRIQVKDLMGEMSLVCLRRVEKNKSMVEEEVDSNEMKVEAYGSDMVQG